MIITFFEKFGEILEANIVGGRHNVRHGQRGCAFLTFRDKASIECVLNRRKPLHIKGRRIDCFIAKPNYKDNFIFTSDESSRKPTKDRNYPPDSDGVRDRSRDYRNKRQYEDKYWDRNKDDSRN